MDDDCPPEDPDRRELVGLILGLPALGALGALAARAFRRPATREAGKIGGRMLLEPQQERRLFPYEKATAAGDRPDKPQR